MKLNKSNTTLLLLVLIAFNIAISNSEQIKNTKSSFSRKTFSSHKHKLNKKSTRSHSSTKTKTKNVVWDTLKSVLLDPKNIIYFSLGVAAEFVSEAEIIYKEIKPVITLLEPCYDAVKGAYKKYSEARESEAITELRKSESIKLLEETLAKKENQKEFCVKSKEEISQIFLKATWEIEPNKGGVYSDVVKLTPDFLLEMSYKIAKNVVSKS